MLVVISHFNLDSDMQTGGVYENVDICIMSMQLFTEV